MGRVDCSRLPRLAAHQIMKALRHLLFALGSLAAAVLASADLLPLADRVSLTATGTSSTLNRGTGMVDTTVQVRLINDGDRLIEPPLHLVVRFAGETGAVTVVDAEEGPGRGPYDAHYLDWSVLAPGGLSPGALLDAGFVFARSAGVSVAYSLEAYGLYNRDPVAIASIPEVEVSGESLGFDAAGSIDPDGGELSYFWDFGDGATSTEVSPLHVYANPGVYLVRLRVTDPKGASDEVRRAVLILPPGAYALARVRTLDGVGQPLPGVRIERLRASGDLPGFSDATGFFVDEGTPGPAEWKFTREGYLPVWREFAFEDRAVVLVASPWLAREAAKTIPVSPLAGAVLGGNAEAATITLPEGAVSQPGPARLTSLGGQTLPLPLPLGWSPLAAFHISLPGDLLESGVVDWRPGRVPRITEQVAAVVFEPAAPAWRVVDLPEVGALPVSRLEATGWMALVVADEGPTAPPIPEAGELLGGGDPGSGGNLVAEGYFDPAQATASSDPAVVTTRGRLYLEGDGPMASGRLLRADLTERYHFVSGGSLRTPDYDTTFFAYREPLEALPNRLLAEFPLRPTLLIASSDLVEVRILATILDAAAFGGVVIDPAGGQLAIEGLTLVVPADAFVQRTVGELRALDPLGFSALLGGLATWRAFQLDAPRSQQDLEVTFDGLPADREFILARLVSFVGRQGLEPVLRLRSDSSGKARSIEPAVGFRLPGVMGGGRYVLIEVETRPGLVTGVVRGLDEIPAEAFAAGIVGQPWTSLTRAGGTFVTLAPAGTGVAEGFDPNANRGTAGFELLSHDDVAEVDIQVVPTGPRVIATTPVHGAVNVNPVAPILITFSEPIDPASFGPAAFELAVVADDFLVPGSLGLNAAATVATFLPTNPLSAATDYVIRLGPDIRDRGGLPIEGDLEFTFRTRAPSVRGIGAELVIFEPGAENVPEAVLSQLVGYEAGAGSSHVIATGGPGTADPEVAVILVNETTGETATVLSRPDGSFATFINADEGDFVSAVFVNANETRVTIPATRQHFDDGRIGLYRAGGILEAESEGLPVQVIVQPEAVPSRTVFRVEPVNRTETLALLNDVEPADGGLVLAGLRYFEQGDPLTVAADVVFRISRADFPSDVDPENAAFALALPVEVDGVISFEVIDSMAFVSDEQGDRLVTSSPPFIGLLLRQLNAFRSQTGFQDSFNIALAAGDTGISVGSQMGAFLLGIMIAPVAGQKVAGKVISLAEGESIESGNARPLGGAFVRLEVGLGAVNTSTPGLFRRGEVFASSDPEGRFAFVLATSFNRRLVATHPRFPFQRAASGAIPAGSALGSATLVFRRPAPVGLDIEDTAAPLISVTQNPPRMGSGTGPDDGGILIIDAVDDLWMETVGIARAGFYSLADGRPLSTDLLLPPELIDENQPSLRLVRARYRVRAVERGTAVFSIIATDAAGNLATTYHSVIFGDPATGESERVKTITTVWPPHGATGQTMGTPIRFRFNEALPLERLVNLDWIRLGPTGDFVLTDVLPSADFREITLHYFVRNTLSQRLTIEFAPDVVGRLPLAPGLAASESYSIEFAAARELTMNGPDVGNGGGVVLLGSYVYVIDRKSGFAGELQAFRLDAKGELHLIQTIPVPQRISDLVAIPSYPLREFDGSVRPPASYVATFSGGPTDIKRLGLYQVGQDGKLTAVFDAPRPIALDISTIAKAKWDPPYFAFKEIAGDGTPVSLVNFNAFYIGMKLQQERRNEVKDLLPPDGRLGVDLNNNGHFADPGDIAPLPSNRDGQLFGLEFSWLPENSAERFRDFDFSSDFGLLGAVYSGPTGHGLMMRLGGGAILDDEFARVSLPAEPKRMLFLPGTELLVNGVPLFGDFALAGAVARADGSGTPLFVVDITDPANPVLVGEARFPPLFGSLNTMIRRADGIVALSTSNKGIVLLDPRRLLEVNPDGSGFTNAIIKRMRGLSGGGQRSFVAEDSGLAFSANATPLKGSIDAPRFRFITFERPPFAIEALRAGQVGAGLTVEEKTVSLLSAARTVTTGRLFGGDTVLDAVDPEQNFYIEIAAPGVSGPTLELALAAVDRAGRPVLPTPRNAVPTFLGNEEITARYIALTAFNVFKNLNITEGLSSAVESLAELGVDEIYERFVAAGKPSYPTGLEARRLSDDPTHPLFNRYLAGPVVILGQDLRPADFSALQSGLDRRYVAAAGGLWVGLSPMLPDDLLVKPFAARQDEEAFFELSLKMEVGSIMRQVVRGASLFFSNPTPMALIQFAASFVDVELERSLAPGANAYMEIGRSRNPLVFVPGIMGSLLENEEGELRWVDLTDALNTDVVKLTMDQNSNPAPGIGEDISASRVVTFIPDSLNHFLSPFRGADMAGSMLEFLVGDMGYRLHNYRHMREATFPFVDAETAEFSPSSEWREVMARRVLPTLFPFAYDWRKDNADAARELADYIDFILSLHPDAEAVDIIAHSMGGLVARRVTMDYPGKVGTLVTVASPFAGATKAVFSKRTGNLDDLKLNLIVKPPLGLGSLITRHMPGLDQLMPSWAAFELGFRPLWQRGLDLNGDTIAFGPLNYGAYRDFIDRSWLEGVEAEEQPKSIKLFNQPFHTHGIPGDNQGDWSFDERGTRLFQIVGVQTLPNTIQRINLTPRLEQLPEEESWNVSLNLPPAQFTRPNTVRGGGVLVPEDPGSFPVSQEAWRIKMDFDVIRGAGDGTVPLLLATRGKGAEGRFDLNPPRMRLIPVMAEDTSSKANKRVDHVGVLVNPTTKRWVAQILDGLFNDADLPRLVVNGPADAGEGLPITLSASIDHRPEGLIGEPEYVWDLGDGRLRSGPEVTFAYPKNGDYVVTLVGRFPGEHALTGKGGTGGLTSHHIRVFNQPPDPVILINEPVLAGQTFLIRVDPRDPAVDDTHHYVWDTGDRGRTLTTLTPFLRHNFAVPGEYEISVEVTDDFGATGTASRTLRVHDANAGPSGADPVFSTVNSGDGGSSAYDRTPAAGLEMVRIIAFGVRDDEDLIRAFHDQRLVLGQEDDGSFFFSNDGGAANTFGENRVQIDLYRQLVRGTKPQRSRVRLFAAGEEVRFLVEFYDGQGNQRCVALASRHDEGDEINLTIEWESFLGLAEEQLAHLTDPIADSASILPGCGLGQYAPDQFFEPTLGNYHLEMVRIDQEPISGAGAGIANAGGTHRPTFIDEGPFDPVNHASFPSRIFRLMERPTAHATVVSSQAEAVLGLTSTGSAVINSVASSAVKDRSPQAEAAGRVRDSVRSVFEFSFAELPDAPANASSNLVTRFALSTEDLRVLEQGTGAVIWKGDDRINNSAYVKGKSDHDYELFFPVWMNPPELLDEETFTGHAHTPEMMTGDWYFRAPHGYAESPDSGPISLGPAPTGSTAAIYEAYLAEVTWWGYDLPRDFIGNLFEPMRPVAQWSGYGGAFTTTDQPGRLLVRRDFDPFQEGPGQGPFHHPQTPASIIAYALTQQVKLDPEVREEVLSDVSFFPFRLDHFDIAVMSLEKPPPFGDDPLGDAGMGRSLLLLKWLLEGVFVPPIQPSPSTYPAINGDLDDMAYRTLVHSQLQQRRELLRQEAYEWALYQEFALLTESAHLRVRRVFDPASPPLVFSDFTTAHDDKMMKKAGKAAIRTALGVLMRDSAAANAVLAVTPQVFHDRRYRSFEHFIEARARERIDLFSRHGIGGAALTAQDFADILGAKSGDPGAFERIRHRPGGVDRFLQKCFSLINKVQRDAEDDYLEFLQLLHGVGDLGALAQAAARSTNASAIQHGFQSPVGQSRPGRLAMHGLVAEPEHEASWGFIVNLMNNASRDIGPLSLAFLINESEGETMVSLCDEIQLLATDRPLVLPNRKRGLCLEQSRRGLFKYRRGVTDRSERDFEIVVTGIPNEFNRNPYDDLIELRSYFLSLPIHRGPDFRDFQIIPTIELLDPDDPFAANDHVMVFRVVGPAGEEIPDATINLPPDTRHPTRPNTLVYVLNGEFFGDVPRTLEISATIPGVSEPAVLTMAASLGDYYQDRHVREPTAEEAVLMSALRKAADSLEDGFGLRLQRLFVPHAWDGLRILLEINDPLLLRDRLLQYGVEFIPPEQAEERLGKPLLLVLGGTFDNRVYLPDRSSSEKEDHGFNPGRANTETHRIYIHNELFEQALAGNTNQIERLHGGDLVADQFGSPDLQPLDFIKSEFTHELNTRFLRSLSLAKLPDDTNQSLDGSIAAFYPAIEHFPLANAPVVVNPFGP
ncbi:MAG: PKD domain-containing protein [Puniceicoccaceae bacterium]|nr:MAG: PKD domain-containing protein [Puniceicoccaceae bacterium]